MKPRKPKKRREEQRYPRADDVALLVTAVWRQKRARAALIAALAAAGLQLQCATDHPKRREHAEEPPAEEGPDTRQKFDADGNPNFGVKPERTPRKKP